jgi:hypothetical protein
VSDPRVHLFGVRHHGPGSAASLVAALDALDPAIVLIEGPADAQDAIAHAAAPGAATPLAILVYDAQNPARSSFSPFAEFSPEWRAIRWAQARGRPVRFIDQPFGMDLAAQDAEALVPSEPTSADTEEAEDSEAQTPDDEIGDPLTLLAEAAGASDGESWWNALVEQTGSGAAVFAAIAEAMTTLRAHVEETRPISPREARREAHMRLAIAEAAKEIDGAVAVVCGAWHVPALARKVAAKDDRARLKGLKPVKTSATWAPWSAQRLAAASGYGAGVISPGWYAHLWREFQRPGRTGGDPPVELAARWQARVAELLRGEGLLAATASVIEAARLAISLAAVRGRSTPGLSEMQDASLAVLCHGDDVLLSLIVRKLVVGEEIGAVGEGAPQTPLAEDLDRQRKKMRLKLSEINEEIALDLRSEAGLAKSTLLHRLGLLGVEWGRLNAGQSGRGTFREVWTLAWRPEFSVKLAEASRFGSTLVAAAAGAALEDGLATRAISRVSELIALTLNADLPDAAEALTTRLQALSVGSDDIAELMQAAPPLIQTLRYGEARKLPREALTGLVRALSAEICVGLPQACAGLSADAVTPMKAAMRAYDAAIPLFEDGYAHQAWLAALSGIEASEAAAPALRGLALRRLYDAQKRDADAAFARLSRALSPGAPTGEASDWLEGFLDGAAQLLLHDERLRGVVDAWLSGVSEDAFVALLPAFRRAVCSFDQMERRRLLEQIRHGARGAAPAPRRVDDAETAAFAAAAPLLKMILGLADG